MQKNKKQIGEDFWLRIEMLMNGENPYSWAVSHGINKSTFQSAMDRGTKPLDRTVTKWAEKIGVNSEWLNTGIGDPYDPSPQPLTQAMPDTDGIDTTVMIEALTIVEDYLTQHDKRMDADKKAELIVHIYDLLCKSPDAGQAITSVLKLAI